MTLYYLGMLAVVVWPLYNLALAAWMGRDHLRRRRRPAVEPAPLAFWIVVPCLNEERVVANTVRNALGLDRPPGSTLRVLAVDDASDDQTPVILGAIYHPDLHILRRELPAAQQGKGEALNAAYRYIREQSAREGADPASVVVGVIDGDGRGSATMLTEVARILADPAVGAAQCGVRIHNRHQLVAAVQDFEFACIVNASQLMRHSFGSVGLGGNGQFTRLSALVALGDAPWSSCLVEDFELGLRMHLAGIGIRYVSRAHVTQQGLTDVRRLTRQRTRWAQGNLQCLRYLRALWSSPQVRSVAFLEICYYLLAPWWNAFGTVGTSALLLYSLRPHLGDSPGDVLHHWAVAALTGGALGTTVVAPFVLWGVLHRLLLGDQRLTRCLLAGLAYPAFLALCLVATARAIGRHVTNRNTWAKTERLAEEPARVMGGAPVPALSTSDH